MTFFNDPVVLSGAKAFVAVIMILSNSILVFVTYKTKTLNSTCNWLIAANSACIALYSLTYFVQFGIVLLRPSGIPLWQCCLLIPVPLFFLCCQYILLPLIALDRLIGVIFPLKQMGSRYKRHYMFFALVASTSFETKFNDAVTRRILFSLVAIFMVEMCGWASYWTVYLLVHFDISEATKWFALSYIGFVMQLTLSLNGPILYALRQMPREAGPGTGKTFTAAAIMAAILKEDPSARVLALAPTNIAAVKLVMEMEGVLRVEGHLAHRHAHLAAAVDSDLAFAEQNSSLFGGGLSYGHNGPRKLLITGYRRQLWAHLPLLPFTIRKKLDLDTIIENMDAALGVDVTTLSVSYRSHPSIVRCVEAPHNKLRSSGRTPEIEADWTNVLQTAGGKRSSAASTVQSLEIGQLVRQEELNNILDPRDMPSDRRIANMISGGAWCWQGMEWNRGRGQQRRTLNSTCNWLIAANSACIALYSLTYFVQFGIVLLRPSGIPLWQCCLLIPVPLFFLCCQYILLPLIALDRLIGAIFPLKQMGSRYKRHYMFFALVASTSFGLFIVAASVNNSIINFSEDLVFCMTSEPAPAYFATCSWALNISSAILYLALWVRVKLLSSCVSQSMQNFGEI
ncbi:hypothetical protein GPALN_002073 [Globodera pallida]|nr:hypothetical protein GPALN_002073 [Globodera pallida]